MSLSSSKSGKSSLETQTPMENSIRSIDAPRLEASAPPTKKKNKARIVGIGLVTAALLGGGAWYVLHLGKETTDDAQVEGHVAAVSPRVARPGRRACSSRTTRRSRPATSSSSSTTRLRGEGRRRARRRRRRRGRGRLGADAARAHRSGTSDAILRQARGGVTQASSGVTSSQAAIDQATRRRRRRRVARQKLAQHRVRPHREPALDRRGLAGRARQPPDRRSTQANAGLSRRRARGSSPPRPASGTARAPSSSRRAGSPPRRPRRSRWPTREAAVKVAEARVAPGAGGAASRRAQPLVHDDPRARRRRRRRAAPSRPGRSSRPTARSWRSCRSTTSGWSPTSRKTSSPRCSPARRPSVTVDAFGGDASSGHVDSLAGGTGSRFALLPPDNASGNFIKVVQRVPVLIRLDGDRGRRCCAPA